MQKNEQYDFSGWATKNNLKCSDGRIIMRDAFKQNDGLNVPLVWNHEHNDPLNVLGHAMLENRDEGVYAYCYLNDTESGKAARTLIEHGDVCSLSIYANQLKQNGPNVLHGSIREVSLVLAGANPGAYIDTIIAHSDNEEEECIITTGEDIKLAHADKPDNETDNEETIGDVFNTLTEKQKKVVYAMIGIALGEKDDIDDNNNKEEKPMKHNVFDEDTRPEDTISHSDMQATFADVRRYGSLRDSALAHGIEHIDYLFPDAETMESKPLFINNNTDWVQKVMNGVHHTPFSRIKSVFADISEDDARAKGYIAGNYKKEEVFSLLKRTTTPTTVYKKQKFDRDDLIDITDFEAAGWIKTEMRMKLDEELAIAYLIGDGRLSSSDDKINEQNIRPIVGDEDLFNIKAHVAVSNSATDDDKAKAFIRTVIKARKNYKGSGNPQLFTTEDMLTNMLLLEDNTGRALYDDVSKLATKLRVKEIVTVPPLEGRTNSSGNAILGILVNLADYNVGADKGGSVNMFDDFDIDYNAQKYLIETRCSGALTKPYSAITFDLTVSG